LVRRNAVLRKNRPYWALRDAHPTIDTFNRMDYQKIGAFMETFNWTNTHATSVFASDAAFSHYVSHFSFLISCRKMRPVFIGIQSRRSKHFTFDFVTPSAKIYAVTRQR
jgi:hypothetical protein